MTAPASRRSLIRSVWNGVLDAVFPPQCVSCRAWGQFLCADCEAQLQVANGPRCEFCWEPGMSPCAACLQRRPAFEAARSAYAFEGPARDLVHTLKYHGVSAVAVIMAEAMAACLSRWDIKIDLVVPVPMASSRQRRRGYNQAARLATEISAVAGLPVEERAIRRLAGASQVEQPTREARRANAAIAYEATDRVVAGNILLVDDAMTTGATLDACARVLKKGGARRVYGLTFARES